MDRRTFNKLAGIAAAGTLMNIAPAANAETQSELWYGDEDTGYSPHGHEVLLEDQELMVAFDSASGALTRLEHKSSSWLIQRRPELGISFRLLAPLPNRRDNFVLGHKQRAAKVEKKGDNRIVLEWRDLISEHGGTLPITFSSVVTLQDGTLTFESSLKNDSNLTIETVSYPYFGDLAAPALGEMLSSESMMYGDLEKSELSPVFHNAKGYWGVDYPTKTVDSHWSLFDLIQTTNQGLYVGMHDPTQPYLLQFTFEQHPGVADSISDQVPKSEEISGTPVHLEFRACHFLFAHPQTTYKLAPVVIKTYSGDWHSGVDIYKEWRKTWFVQRGQVPVWVAGVNAWQQLQINTPEQDYTIPYRDLTRYIDECAANGVAAIQLVGWNIEGQDGGDPCLDTDPGLGTWQELHDAIAYARRKGVKMILFAKLSWADMTTPWFEEFHQYAATDPYGIPYHQSGYNYVTPTQLAGINTHRREVMDVLCPEYQEAATKQFQKLLALGAPGWLYDEVCYHGGVEYSFNPNHGYTPPGYIYKGDMPIAQKFHDASDKLNPEFLFVGEGAPDWLMQDYPMSYFRITGSSRAVCRYIDSQTPLMVAVTGFDDREMLNLILLNRYIISYEPYNFKGQLTDFPLTLAYGKKIDALRNRYKDRLWNSEFRDTLGAAVTANGSHRHSVFVTPMGKRTIVVVNEEKNKTIQATVAVSNAGSFLVATPENPDSRPGSPTLSIPPRSAAVLMEQ
jgi:hypothetical protein